MGKKKYTETERTDLRGLPIREKTTQRERSTTLGVPHGKTRTVDTTTTWFPKKQNSKN
jgi:hypothetical protein